VITLFISSICRDAWFVKFGSLQNEVFLTFKEFTLNHKIYLGDNNMLDVCGKGTIVFNLLNGISKCNGDVLHVLKLARNLL
jgi:hypothetical protein